MQTQAAESPCATAVSLQKSEPFRCVAIVGVGLIGGSLGMALRTRGLADRVIGVDRSEEVVLQAQSAGAIDSGTVDLAAVREADCVVFATPVGVLPTIMASAAPFVHHEAVVTDVGSVKRSIAAAGEGLFGTRFIGGHPMAGSEASGVDAARPDLFEGAPWTLMTPRAGEPLTSPAGVRVSELVTSVGAHPVFLTVAVHDHLVSLISHLPHVLAFAFAQSVASDPEAARAVEIAGGSYRDLARLSHSSPEVWADIFLDNRDEITAVLSTFQAALHSLVVAIEAGDKAALLRWLSQNRVGV